METTLTIPRNPVYPPSMDFARLRREGIRHIERMGSGIWTDYNAHDPGITILEVLCYALTDLGHRTNLPPADLFAPNPAETGRKPYFTAAEILPNEPITARDIRKILIDLPGIHNAWVSARQEPEVLVNFHLPITIKETEFESFWANVNKDRKAQDKITPVAMSILGSEPTNKAKDTSNKFTLQECLDQAIILARKCDPVTAVDDAKSAKEFWGAFVEKMIGEIRKIYPSLEESEQNQLLFHLISLQPISEEIKNPLSLYIPQGIYQIYLLLESDCDESEITQAALAQLHAHRNLGEDFHPEFIFIERQPIALCANIELAPDAHADEVLPMLYEAISEHLSPTLRFYTLQEMMDKNGVFHLSETSLSRLAEAQLPLPAQQALTPLLNTEFAGRRALMDALRRAVGPDVFADYEALLFYHAEKRYDAHPVYQGPLLTHGFLDDAELDKAQLRQTIYKSDLYQLLLAVPGVVAIQNLVLDHCHHDEDPNSPRGILHDKWCLSCGCNCLPELDLDCSKFSFTKGSGLGYVQPDVQTAREAHELLRMKHTALDRQGSLDLPFPSGSFRPDLADFTSIQEDFPMTYHVGREGIARTEPAWRQARAKQLKAYLLFYDQLLANYLAHLAEVRNLLAIDNNPDTTPNRLHQLPQVPGLLSLLQNGDATAYEEALAGLVNGTVEEQQLSRNKLLDHLMARFGEQFTDFALQYYPIERPAEASPYGNLSGWISQKQTFLANLPSLGNGRGRGFDYRAQPQIDNLHVWKSPNVAGLKRRVCAQLGIPQSKLERMPLTNENDPHTTFALDWTRHPISTEPGFVVETFVDGVGSRRRYRVGLKTSADEADNLLVSKALYAKRTTADQAGDVLFGLAADPARYGIRQLATKSWVVGFWENVADVPPTPDTGSLVEPLMESPLPFASEKKAEDALKAIRKRAEAQDQDDSFHLIEHILLRPRTEGYTLLNPAQPTAPVSVPPLARLDPYSFQLTVVVPYWVKRFNDPMLASQFEQTLRLETPAHLSVTICRYEQKQMLEFETAYLNWLLVNSNDSHPSDLRDATNGLIKVLNDTERVTPKNEHLTQPDCPSKHQTTI